MACAKYYASIIAVYALTLGFSIVLALFIFRDVIIRTFTNEEEMILQVMSVLPIFYVHNIIDMSYSFFVGVVRALGTQDKVAHVSVIGYWLLSIPAASVCGFALHWGTFGLWLGYCFGFIILTFIVAILTAKEDW